LGVDAIRILDGVTVAWGARTMQGDAASERWALFEPNDEPVWARIRSVVGAFLHQLFRLGASRGGPTTSTSSDAGRTR